MRIVYALAMLALIAAAPAIVITAPLPNASVQVGKTFPVIGTTTTPAVSISSTDAAGNVTLVQTVPAVTGAINYTHPAPTAPGPLSFTITDGSGASVVVTVQVVAAVSPDGTVIARVAGKLSPALLYPSGRTYAIDDTGGKAVISKSGVLDTRTSNVLGIGILGTNVYQTAVVPARFWEMPDTSGTGAWTEVTQANAGPFAGASPPKGTLAVSGGQIVDSTGVPFVFRGISVLDDEMGKTPPAGIKALIPQMNAIMLAIGADNNGYASAQSNAAIVAYVQAANALGIWVGLSDYVPGQPNVRSGQDLTNSFNWYASLAKATVGLNVFWTTANEVGGTLDPSFQGIYNAIRGAGNSGLIFFETQFGNPGTGGMSASTFAQMTGIGFNLHAYPWAYSGSSQAAFDAEALNFINQLKNFAKSADGVMPIIMGEGGNSSGGSTVDDTTIGGKFATVQSTLDMLGRNPGFSGALMWLHDWQGTGGDADEIVVNGALTQYGQQIAGGF